MPEVLRQSEDVYSLRSDTGDIDIRIADERVAALWGDSTAAVEEFPDQRPIVRKAVRPRFCTTPSRLARVFLALPSSALQQLRRVPKDSSQSSTPGNSATC